MRISKATVSTIATVQESVGHEVTFHQELLYEVAVYAAIATFWLALGLGLNTLREGDGRTAMGLAYMILTALAAFLFLVSLPVHAQSCGSAGCTDHYTTLSNQGGGWKPCQTNSVEEGIPTQVSADNAGSYSDHPWNYIVSGHLNVNNPNRQSALVHLQMLMGQGPSFIAQDEIVTVEHGFHQVQFRGVELDVPPSVYVGFWVYLTPDKSIGCISTDYLTEEHD